MECFFFLFMPAGHGEINLDEMKEFRKHRAHVPLLLAEKMG